MSVNNSFKKTFIFRFVQKPSSDCAITKSLKTLSNQNNPKRTIKIE